jgi:preprotein translocase subunit YajC
MNFFIPDAYAATSAAPADAGQFSFIIVILVLFAGMWILMIRPQQKRQKELQKMIAGLSKGDELVTVGGVLGRVKDLDDQFITLEVAPGVDHRIQRQAVSAVMPKGTLKNHLK